ncbi:hypothetical protein FJZ17_02885 [Candidatus Pacearchaeota archaeon]|nr:hypothetical protein [Candidatus Pacearchaeota archaeon]
MAKTTTKIIISVIIVVVLIFGAYLFLKPTPSKNFVDTSYGFEVSYPQDLVLNSNIESKSNLGDIDPNLKDMRWIGLTFSKNSLEEYEFSIDLVFYDEYTFNKSISETFPGKYILDTPFKSLLASQKGVLLEQSKDNKLGLEEEKTFGELRGILVSNTILNDGSAYYCFIFSDQNKKLLGEATLQIMTKDKSLIDKANRDFNYILNNFKWR